jgi:uncharacterized iron-regulated membrane protein
VYSVVWRWHFYAGLLTAPILWVVTVTGAVYAFRTELTAWRDRPWQVVEPGPTRLSYDRLRERAAEELGTHDLDGMVAFPDPARSVVFIADVEGDDPAGRHRHRHLYLNPYTGEALGQRVAEEDFFAVVLELHRSLLLGTTGRVLGELATSWAIVLIATGVYLWWPRGKSNAGVWLPRTRRTTYATLRDWHAVGGLYMVPLAAVVAATGLFFSVVWGTGFNTTVQKLGHWPPEWFAPPKSAPAAAGTAPAPLDDVVAAFLAHGRSADDAAMIRLAPKPDAAHRAFFMRDEDKNTLRMVVVDQYTARVARVSDVADVPALYQLRVLAVSVHMGQIAGTPTKILAVVACLALLGLSATGCWMWWRRRPRGRTGFPRRPAPRSVPRWGWAVVVAAGVAMPVAGASMVLIVVLDLTLARAARWSGRRPAGRATPVAG